MWMWFKKVRVQLKNERGDETISITNRYYFPSRILKLWHILRTLVSSGSFHARYASYNPVIRSPMISEKRLLFLHV